MPGLIRIVKPANPDVVVVVVAVATVAVPNGIAIHSPHVPSSVTTRTDRKNFLSDRLPKTMINFGSQEKFLLRSRIKHHAATQSVYRH